MQLIVGLVKPKTIKLVFVASTISMKQKEELARNQDKVSEWSKCRPADYCFSELALQNPTECVDLLQNGNDYHHPIKM